MQKNFKIISLGIFLTIYLVLSSCLTAQSNDLAIKNNNKTKYIKNTGSSSSKKVAAAPKNKDEMVIVNVVNFGRKNPFKPYKKYSMVTGDLGSPPEIPPPPTFDPDSENELKNLMEATVNGILYDPSGKSVAIINIKGVDYMVRKRDSIYGFYVQNISRDSVTIGYGNNIYNVSVGENIGEINTDPVVRNNQNFGGASYTLPPLNRNGL